MPSTPGDMSESYLEVTFRRRRLIAAYYYLPFGRGGRPIGIEIADPERVSVVVLNRVLRELGAEPVRRADLRPLLAA